MAERTCSTPMTFMTDYNRDGSVNEISVLTGFVSEVDFSGCFLQQLAPPFLAHGDGLITLRCKEGTATYGITGPACALGEAGSVHAVLLSVRDAD